MTRIQAFATAILLAACGTDAGNGPCDGAKSGEACRWAGTGEQGLNREHQQLPRAESLLNLPADVTFGPDGRAYIVDWNNHMIRRVEKDQTLARVVGAEYEGDGTPEEEGRPQPCNAQGALGTDVALNHPTSATFGPDGLLYIAAWHNNKIRTLDPATGIVKTIAGNFYGNGGDGGPACAATFNQPSSLAILPDMTMYVADQRNVKIRKITPDGMIYPYAGDGHEGYVGDGGLASTAEFGWDTTDTPPVSGSLVAVDHYLYVSDSRNNRIRRIDLETTMIECVAGSSATEGYTGDGGAALDATFAWPLGLALGPDGRLYVADRDNNVVRAIDLTTGVVETVVGDGTLCDTAVSACPDRAPALAMELNQPYGVGFDGDGNLYVADTLNSRVIKVVR